MPPTKSWKAFERRIAVWLGGKRRGADYGGRAGGKCDIIHDVLAPECKLLKKPTWRKLVDALNQSCASVDASEGKAAVAIVKENHPGVHDKDAVVVMWLDDFCRLMKGRSNGEQEGQDEEGR